MSKAYIPKALRNRITRQAQGRCGYCLTQAGVIGAPLEIEHILAEALGGPTEEANLWLACSPCNTFKGNRIAAVDPESGTLVRLFHPREQQWHDHFAWSSNGDVIIGKTAVGRATIAGLRLNRTEIVHARRLWVNAGWHPPEDE
ncbi:MAG: HNH endonuclease [Chloroflexaceae bacterium]|jgi:hypothetical protein|nr:HNH endonuclease [Chloroflexaceae bacterium]